MIQDRRTEDEKRTHTLAVVGTDVFMSGWGAAEAGPSYAAWAFKDGDLARCLCYVQSRGDMKRIRIVSLKDYRPKAAHTSIYIFKNQDM